jgi:hypothetical protein
VMSLTATEFIRRFLLHVLPSGLIRIRQYEFLANREQRKKLASCCRLLGACARSEPFIRPSIGPCERAAKIGSNSPVRGG